MRRFLQSFLLALQNIRSNLFHTLLSVLGIVIGVGALVSILSLIDGMERFASDQITNTTSLNMISVTTNAFKKINGITIRKDSATILQIENFHELKSALSKPSQCFLFQRITKEIHFDKDTALFATHVTSVSSLRIDSLLSGQVFTEAEVADRASVCVITTEFAKMVDGQDKHDEIIGRKIEFGGLQLTVVGVVEVKRANGPEVFFPLTLLAQDDLKRNPPQFVAEADRVEDVSKLKEEISDYLNKTFTTGHDFTISTNEFRVAQAAKGFRLFRIIMGLIVGISVVVGGVGVMNVLLISVTERTAEIGIRKAVGANKRDIILLFLAEAIAVSAFGSFVGLIFGVLFTMAAVPIVKAVTEIPFQADYTLNTLGIISFVALVVGIVFGTYPAVRASKLNPVDAIRHE